MDKDQSVKDFLNKSYEKAELYLKDKNYKNALSIISCMAQLQYEYNQWYTDMRSENYLEAIGETLAPDVFKKTEHILFCDGFGFDTRGLADIYIRALCKNEHFVYVTYKKRQNNIPGISKVIQEKGGTVAFLKEENYYKQLCELIDLIKEYSPHTIFMYTSPADVVITTALMAFKGKANRIQINLTDHAFWLGVKSIDKCIEFRNYGMYLTSVYRKISQEKIYYLPYYPVIHYEHAFEGFPFPFDEAQNKLVFSGGALYKTMDSDHAYYKFVEYLLSQYPDIVFWYAGQGNEYSQELRKLMRKWPQRVFWTNERKDLYEILKRSYFYLNTYPIGGGLMVQYAVIAGTIPIMVKYDDNSSGVLLNQEKLEIVHDSFDSAQKTVQQLMNMPEYRQTLVSKLKNSVITQEAFETGLQGIVNNTAKPFDQEIYPINTSRQRSTYNNNFSAKDMERYFLRKETFPLLLGNPKLLLNGIRGRINKYINA